MALVLALAIFAARAFDVYRAEGRRPRGALFVAALLAVLSGAAAIWPDASGSCRPQTSRN